jgi:hypothetical protein
MRDVLGDILWDITNVYWVSMKWFSQDYESMALTPR